MARVIHASRDEFSALVHGLPTQNSINFIKQQAQSFAGMVGELAGTTKEMFQNVYDTVVNYDFSGLIDRVTNLKSEYALDVPDILERLESLTDLQNANLVTQRWLMANPALRRYVESGKCDGYSSSYFNYEPEYSGLEHTDYQEIVNGLRQMDEEGNSYTYHIRDSQEDPDVIELSVQSKELILRNWALCQSALVEGEQDPTSVFGESIQ